MSETVIAMFLAGGEVSGDLFLFIGAIASLALLVSRIAGKS